MWTIHSILAIGLQFVGDLDVGALEQALQAVVRRHEALRLIFTHDHQGFGLRALPEVRIELFHAAVQDAEDCEEAALAALAAHAMKPWDVFAETSFRAGLARIAPDHHVLGLSWDHLFGDDWSIRVLTHDLLHLYRTYSEGVQSALPELPVQFLDYAAWERSFLQEQVIEGYLSYWRDQLQGTSPIPEVGMVGEPEEKPGGSTTRTLQAVIDPTTRNGVHRVAGENHVSAYVFVSSVLAMLIAGRRRGANQSADPADVAVLAGLPNRIQPELQHVVGYFATPFTLRTHVASDETLTDLLKRQGKAVLGAIRHQQLPHSLVLRGIAPELYGLRHRPGPDSLPAYLSFDMFSRNRHPMPPLPRVDVQPVAIPLPMPPRGGLRLVVRDDGDPMTLSLRYRLDLYSSNWAKQFVDEFCALLSRAVREPDQTVTRLTST